jgi:tellurite resistance protein
MGWPALTLHGANMNFVAPTETPKGLARRVPPAIFPAMLGLFGLGLAWRRAADSFDLPAGLAEAGLGAVTLLFLFALGAYALKLARRPAVVLEDLKVLPGRLGLSAMIATIYLLASTLSLYFPDPARGLLLATTAVHGMLILAIGWVFLRGPAEQRRYSPAGHLYFVSPIVGGFVAAQAGFDFLALGLLGASLMVAALIWAWGVDHLWRNGMAAPLRPLLALHAAPAAVGGLGAQYLQMSGLAEVAAMIAAFVVALLVMRMRWITASGFSPLWGAFAFPLAASASLWISLGGAWQMLGGVALLAASIITVSVAYRIMKLWLSGQLAVRTNAAAA